MAKCLKSERGEKITMTITAKEAIDRLASDPTLSLSFSVDGKPLWWSRVPISQAPMEEPRSKCVDKHSGHSSDDMLINVLKKNPGMELQLMSYHGTFPYLALHVFGAKSLQAPEGMFTSESKICCTEKYYGGTVWLAEIRK